MIWSEHQCFNTSYLTTPNIAPIEMHVKLLDPEGRLYYYLSSPPYNDTHLPYSPTKLVLNVFVKK